VEIGLAKERFIKGTFIPFSEALSAALSARCSEKLYDGVSQTGTVSANPPFCDRGMVLKPSGDGRCTVLFISSV
jgi:hypothetical protein